jgi:hypothetical protein
MNEIFQRLVSAERAATQAIAELNYIANAKRFDRDRFDDDTSFADWAQSRARHTLTLLSEPASTGEIGEIDMGMLGLAGNELYKQHRYALARAVRAAFARLSHPWEQQQLVEALAEAREIVTNFVGIAEDNGLNQRKYVSFGVRVNKFLTNSAALSAHKASDVPTAGDAALREAAKAQAERLTKFREMGCFNGLGYIPGDDINKTIKLLERFAGETP